jgi:transposase
MDHGRLSRDELVTLLVEKEAALREKEAVIAAQQEQLQLQQEALDHAREQVALLKKAMFTPRRERYVTSPDQRLLFEAQPLADTSLQASSSAAPAPMTAGATRPARRPRRPFVIPAFLPVQRQEHPLPAEQCACGHCGSSRVVIGTHVSRQIELEPAKAYVVEHVRYTYACSRCRAGDQVVTTHKPAVPMEKSPFGASTLAWIVAAKFERHLPTYRHQEMLVAPLGLWLSRPLLCRLLTGIARCLKPLAERLLVEILMSRVLQADETHLRFLGERLGKSSLGYMFGYAGDADHRFLYYDFRPNRSRAGPEQVLANYRGVLQTDGYSAYESLVREFSDRLTAAGCWMHARRGFDEALATTSHPLVSETLARIQLLYDIDDRTKGLSFEERRAVHRRESRPLVDQLFVSWDEALPTLRPTTKLAEAISYALNRRTELRRFFDDGRIPLDTGHLERSLRPLTIGRKNFLFFGSLRGGHTAAILYSVVQSARLYHLDVTAYLTDVLRCLPAIDPNDVDANDIDPSDVDAIRPLLPDRWAQSHPEHIHASREDELHDATRRRRQIRARRRHEMRAHS